MKTRFLIIIAVLIVSSFSLTSAYGSIYFDKSVYTWTDKINLKIMEYAVDSEYTTVKIYTTDHEIKNYKLSKVGNGLYIGEVVLCMGGRNMILNDDCVRIGNYDGTTGDRTFYSPLKQLKKGIPFLEIKCNEPLILMSKHDNSPACVSESTAVVLSDRGWSYVLEIIEWENED